MKKNLSLLNKLFFTFLILLIACVEQDNISSVNLIVEVDTTITTIGSPIIYSLTINSPINKIVKFPNWSLDEEIEIRTSSFQNRDLIAIAKYEFVFWDTGKIFIPSINIFILNSDSTLDYKIKADSILVEVISIKDRDPSLQLSSNGDIMPLKDPVPVTFPIPWELIIKIFILLTILVSIVLIWNKRLKAEVSYEEKPIYLELPNIVALRKLDELELLSQVDKLEIKELYAQLSLILREYTENSLFIRTLEMTSDEILSYRNEFPYSKKEIKEYIEILSNSDLTKYAKYKAKIEDWNLDLIKTKDLVANTTHYWELSSIL